MYPVRAIVFSLFHIFSCSCFFAFCSRSLAGGNQVDDLPPASHTGAVAIAQIYDFNLKFLQFWYAFELVVNLLHSDDRSYSQYFMYVNMIEDHKWKWIIPFMRHFSNMCLCRIFSDLFFKLLFYSGFCFDLFFFKLLWKFIVCACVFVIGVSECEWVLRCICKQYVVFVNVCCFRYCIVLL